MEIKYHVPDFVQHFRLNMTLAEYMARNPEMFIDGVVIGSVYGTFPNMIWNGGRLLQGQCDMRILTEMVNQFNKRGIACRFTLTNPMLTEKHLSDPYCNSVLKAVNNGLNGAIVFLPIMEEYVREHFPEMPLTSSTCKQIENFDELCAETEKDYTNVVLDYNFNNNFELLEKLPHKEKAELLINPCCVPQCKRRGEHYRSIGKSQLAYAEHIKKGNKTPHKPELFECACMKKQLYDTIDTPVHISPKAIYEKYVPLGYRNFKIEGRSIPDVNVLENYVYYMVKPEYKDRARLDMLLMLTKSVKYF